MKAGLAAKAPGRPRFRIQGGRLVPAAPAPTAESVDELPVPQGPRVVSRGGKLAFVRKVTEPAEVQALASPEEELAGKPTGRKERILIALFIIALVMPVSWQLGPLRLAPSTVFLAIGFIPLVVMWTGRDKTPIILPDVLILLFCCWSSVALAIAHGPYIEAMGIQFLTTLGAYLTGRMLVRDAQAYRWMVAAAVVVLTVLLPFLIFEALTGKKPLLQMAGLIGTKLTPVVMDPRYGLARAQGPFEHPIAMGIFAASVFSLAVYVLRLDQRLPRIRWLGMPITALACLLSVSSGALLSLNLQIGLMVWSRVLRAVKARWRILTGIVAAMYVAIDLASTKTPFHVFVNYATFSSASSYNRILIWQFGSAEALRHPLFGIGMNDWTRPSWMHASMDNFWLVMAVRYGIPALLMLAGAIILILWRAGRVSYASEQHVMMRRGAIFSLTATMVAVISVHLWNAGYVWFCFLVGASAFLAIPARPAGAGPARGGAA